MNDVAVAHALVLSHLATQHKLNAFEGKANTNDNERIAVQHAPVDTDDPEGFGSLQPKTHSGAAGDVTAELLLHFCAFKSV